MTLAPDALLSIEYVRKRNLERLGRRTFSGVSTDSRTVKQGNLFVALRGENFDGNAFVKQAFAGGAICAIVDERADDEPFREKPHVIVRDTTRAFGELARFHRRKHSIPIIAVAGSNGKTTSKEMISSVLRTRYSVLSTRGNLNNQVGVPQTLFRLKPHHEIGVIEIGTNHAGEIESLCNILEPTHGIITNIGREHLEFFQDLDGVAKAEGELFDALGKSGTGFVNVDDPRIVAEAKRLKRKKSYGFSKRPRVKGTFLALDDRGCAQFSVKEKGKQAFRVELTMPGKHAAQNALAAAAIGLSFGVSRQKIQGALKKFTAVGKRMEVVRAGGVTVLNDTYNANPDSVLSALETLASMRCSGRKIVILADMLELGTASQSEHEQIGRAIGRMGFEFLLTFGTMAKFINKFAEVNLKLHYDQKNVLSEYAAELASPGDLVLVKGSRGMRMEDVVLFLQERLNGRPQ